MAKKKMVICIGSACFANGNAKNIEIIERFLREHALADEIDIELSGALCSNTCSEGPLITVNGKVHKQVGPERMLAIMNDLFPQA